MLFALIAILLVVCGIALFATLEMTDFFWDLGETKISLLPTVIAGIITITLFFSGAYLADIGTAEELKAEKQAIELTLDNENLTEEMKFAYAQQVSEFNRKLLETQADCRLWWNFPFLNQRVLEVEPIK